VLTNSSFALWLCQILPVISVEYALRFPCGAATGVTARARIVLFGLYAGYSASLILVKINSP